MTEPITRKELLKAPLLPGTQVSTLQVQRVTLPPGAKAPLHLHPCPTTGVVLEGRITFQIEGQDEQILAPGDAFYEPPRVPVAKFDNEGSTPASFAVFYLLPEDGGETVRIL